MTKKQADEIERILREGGYTNPKKKDKSDCQYRGTDERYCKATTQTTCDKCRFYEPTTFAKIRMLMEEILRHEAEEARKDKLISERDLMIFRQTQELGALEDELSETIEHYRRELRRAEMIREFIRRYWHG